MRLSCLQENLARGLSVVGRAVATRTTLPITQNVLVSTDQSRLKLAATNTEIAITTWIGAQIEEEGSITIPARLLTELVNSLPAERIDMTSSDTPTSLSINCARFSANINGIDADEFPPIPTVETGVAGKIEPKVLRDAISHVAFAAATEESRPVLTGIKVEIEGDNFTFAAADGFRLAVYKGSLVEALSEDTSFIVPARALQEVNRLIGGQEQPIDFTVTPSKSAALFRLDNVEVVTQLLQGTFPNYSQLIPQSHDTRALVRLDEFLRAARSASIFARDGAGVVRLMVSGGAEGSPGKLSIASKAEELGDNEGDVDAQVDGEEAKIAFNAKYLADVLEVLEETEVALETTTPSSPGVIRPVGTDRYIHVVMPMFVQW
jgi:DNA polymerase-3 subunit beta